jgi:hypothetical protein
MNFERADNGERRTTQVLQLDTAEQTAEHNSGKPGSTDAPRISRLSLKNHGSFENPQLLNARDNGRRRRTWGRAAANATVGLL